MPVALGVFAFRGKDEGMNEKENHDPRAGLRTCEVDGKPAYVYYISEDNSMVSVEYADGTCAHVPWIKIRFTDVAKADIDD